MYGILQDNPEAYSEEAAAITNDFLLYGIGVYVILTAIGLTLSWAVLVWLSNNEGRKGALSRIWSERKGSLSFSDGQAEKRGKAVTLPLIIACILCMGVMTGAVFLLVSRIAAYFGITFY